jgi:pilus assembly protein CpaB
LRKLPIRTSKIYLVVSLVAAALAAFTLLAYLRNMSSRVAENGKLIALVVAARDLEAGEILNPSSLSTVDFPDRYLLPGTFTDPLEITGNTLRYPLKAGEPLLESSLLPPQGGGLAQNSLDDGFRAYPLPSSSVSFPVAELAEGSRVDILAVSEEVAQPVLENVEVLGLSGRYSFAGSTGNDQPASTSSSAECILLQITPEEACLLAAAQERGKVELVLCPGKRN